MKGQINTLIVIKQDSLLQPYLVNVGYTTTADEKKQKEINALSEKIVIMITKFNKKLEKSVTNTKK